MVSCPAGFCTDAQHILQKNTRFDFCIVSMQSYLRVLRKLIDRIEVYEAEGTGKNRTQWIASYYRFVGYLELPAGKINPNYIAALCRGVVIEYIPKQSA